MVHTGNYTWVDLVLSTVDMKRAAGALVAAVFCSLLTGCFCQDPTGKTLKCSILPSVCLCYVFFLELDIYMPPV